MSFRSLSNRLGRVSITLFGVVLSTAFLMSVLTRDQLQEAMKDVEKRDREATEAAAEVAVQLGGLDGRTIGVIVERGSSSFGTDLVKHMTEMGNVALVVYSPEARLTGEGVTIANLAEQTCDDADALLIVNRTEGKRVASPGTRPPLPANVRSLKEKLVMDFGSTANEESAKRLRLFYHPIRSEVTSSRKAEVEEAEAEAQARGNWLVTISLLVSFIGIANALLMSVTERFREIGTLKCLGAMNGFVIQIFLWESTFLGLLGSAMGVLLGFVVSVLSAARNFGLGTVWTNVPFGSLYVAAMGCLIVGVLVSMFASIYPATVAARMVPADAIRTEV